jgi:recombination protein RecA
MTPPKKSKAEVFSKLAKDLAIDNEALELLEDGTFPSWPTGCTIVDILTGIGGLPKGRIVEVFGKYSSGKSNLLISTAAQVQKQGKIVVFLDFERTFSASWAQKLGLDTSADTFIPIRADKTNTVEDGFDIITRLLNSDKADEIGLIIWDSLAGSISAAEANKDSAADHAKMASRAGVLNIELPKLATLLEAKNLDTDTPGGFAFKHSASMRIEIAEVKRITKTATDEFTLAKKIEPIGQRIKFTIEKTKHGQKGRQAEAVFTFQNGFDNAGILIEYAVARGDFTKISAQKFQVPGEFTQDGKPIEGVASTLRNYFYTHPEALDKLIAGMTERINKSYWDKVKSFSFSELDDDITPRDDDYEPEDPNIIDLEGDSDV